MPIYHAPISSLFLFDNQPSSSEFLVIRPFDRTLRSDVSSGEWICFLAYPFSLCLRYPFPKFMMQFFRKTGLSFSQTIPMVWRVLIVLNQIKTLHIPDLCIEDIPIAYRLRSHGSSRFLLFSTSSNPLILKATENEDVGNESFFLSGEIPSLRVTVVR
ncbi:hypothetical protein Hanom_Chr17g01581871 [Helianthus anomalus]